MPEPLVLCYHAVSDQWDHPMAVRPGLLRMQLERVLASGFAPTTLSQAVARPHRRSLVVTFDDGFLSTYTRALPVLRELGVPATAFLPTSFVDTGAPLAWPGFDPGAAPTEDLEPMTWAHARSLIEHGWEIGSHTHTHPVLTSEDDASVRRELAQSWEVLADVLGAPATIAYPFGASDARVRRIAAEVGYSTGVTLGCRPLRSRPLSVPRVGVYRVDESRRFGLKVSTLARSRPAALALNAARGVSRLLPR